ncbi:MAG: ankyrin repeat domain-containing protein [Acidobacteriaceae bacterium]|nr:ankyrin repeat domain-containing protein [Acidobacteriaceae bacterium]
MTDLKAFHEQVKRGDLDGIRAAIAENPELLNATNDSGQSAFLLAKYYGQEDTASYLLSLKPELDIFNACVAGWTSAVLDEVDRSPHVLQAHSSDGWTPLHLAAFFGRLDLADALLDRGAEVNARSTNGAKNTPLHAAAAGGRTNVVELLLRRGADGNARQEGGFTALHSAAQAGNREMVAVLLAHSADVNARAGNNQSPLDLALTRAHAEVAALLEESGAKLQ